MRSDRRVFLCDASSPGATRRAKIHRSKERSRETPLTVCDPAGALTAPDEWHLMVFGVDFVKNIMIFFLCLAGMKMRKPEQEMLAKCFIFMTAGCLANMFVFPAGERMPPMGVAYTVIMTALYAGCFVMAPKTKSKSKK